MRISSMQSEAARRAARKHGKLAPLKLRSSATSAHRPRMRACSSQQRFADRNRAAGQRGRQPTYGGAHLFCEGTIGPTEFCVINVLHHDQGLATTVSGGCIPGVVSPLSLRFLPGCVPGNSFSTYIRKVGSRRCVERTTTVVSIPHPEERNCGRHGRSGSDPSSELKFFKKCTARAGSRSSSAFFAALPLS